ncbi:MAG TPA: carboxymuconolactone decarboxylase family protein [Acidimicrobiales bacterium]|nr:carboxymuconolactone decarboxylase family protein [Acidimicrobiales bacterium]
MTDIDLTETTDTPVLDTLAALTAVSIERCTLDPRELLLTRIAALAAEGAPPASYLLNVGAAAELGVEAADVQNVLIAVAPIIGTPRTFLAARNIVEALGLAIALAESEEEETD